MHTAPLTSYQDQPAVELDEDAQRLWNQHITALNSLMGRVKPARLRLTTAQEDRYALRHAALLSLVIALCIAGSDTMTRIRSIFDIKLQLPATRQFTTQADIWIEPPAYTGKAPIFLSKARTVSPLAKREQGYEVPEDSLLKIRTRRTSRAPKLRYAGKSYTLNTADNGSHTFDLPMQESGSFVLRHIFEEFGRWTIRTIPDTPPEVKLISTDVTPQGALIIKWSAQDDYGITGTTVQIVRDFERTPARSMRDDFISFQIPGPNSKKKENGYTIDLTSHLMAGQPVQMRLIAEDARGHVTATTPFSFRLPERRFQNPLAQMLVGERKKLGRLTDRINLLLIARHIYTVAVHPELYKGDIVQFMALGNAWRRLIQDGSPEAIRTVRRLLWDIALVLEDGGLTTAAQDLNIALQNLSESLDNADISQAEIQQLMQEMQQAMQNYMQTLARELAQRLAQDGQVPYIPQDLADKFMKKVDLGEMMRQMEELAGQNSREALQKMAEMMKRAIENIDLNNIQQMQEKQVKAMQALEKLQKLIDDQQALMDETGRADEKEEIADISKTQSLLRTRLGQIMRDIGEVMQIPENFGDADQEMKQAMKKLDDRAPQSALKHQQAAIDALQKGMDQAMENMAEQMQTLVFSFGGGNGQKQEQSHGEGYDPLGRRQSGGANTQDIDIPDEQQRRRVQQIIEELRNRSNDNHRPKVERDYIDRLLDLMN